MKTQDYTEQTTTIAIIEESWLEVVSCESLNIYRLQWRHSWHLMDMAWVNLAEMNINAGWDNN